MNPETSNFNSLAAFKRAMQPGTKWLFKSNWHPTLAVRECTHSQSNSFALRCSGHFSTRTRQESSWCDWPKAKQVTFVKTPELTHDEVRIDFDGGWLFYRLATEEEIKNG